MTLLRTAASLAGLLTVTVLAAGPADAADIRVLTAGAYRPVLDAIVPGFETRSGNKVILVTDTAGGVAARVARGDAFDIAVLTPATSAEAEKTGKLILVTPIASVGMGVAIKAGAAKPDIATPAALKTALLAAPSVAMADPALGGTSGAYLAKMFDQLGIADQMKPKLILTQGGLPAEQLVSGKAAMALGQASELLAVQGITMAGPLPGALQSRTVYVAGMNPKAAEAPLILLAVLASADTRKVLEEKGMGPP